MSYDRLHRILTEKADGVNNSWTYGPTGCILTEFNANATKTYTYNNKGLIANESTKIGSDTFKISRTYDTRGNDRQDDYYKNGTVYEKRQYVYDNKNRLAGVGIAPGTSSTFTRKVTYYYDKMITLHQLIMITIPMMYITIMQQILLPVWIWLINLTAASENI